MINLILSDENCIEWKNGSNIENPTFFTADNLNKVNTKTKEALTTLMSMLQFSRQTFGEFEAYAVGGAVKAILDGNGNKITDTYLSISSAETKYATKDSLNAESGERKKIENTLSTNYYTKQVIDDKIATVKSGYSIRIETLKNVRIRVTQRNDIANDGKTKGERFDQKSVDLFESGDTPFNVRVNALIDNEGTVINYLSSIFVKTVVDDRYDYDYLYLNIDKKVPEIRPTLIKFSNSKESNDLIAVLLPNITAYDDNSGEYSIYRLPNTSFDFENDKEKGYNRCTVEFIYET